MSDGPYKSLPMARGWKKVAQAAENYAHSPRELRDLLVDAALGDVGGELPRSLVLQTLNALEASESDLFGDRRAVIALLEDNAIGPTPRRFLNHLARQSEREGLSPDAVVKNAILEIAKEGALARIRQVEEHYQREAKPSSAGGVRNRLFEALDSAEFSSLKVDRNTGGVGSSRHVTKRSGLDDGVDL